MPKIKVISNELKSISSRIGQNSDDIISSQQIMMSLIKDMGPGFSGTYPSVMLQYLLGIKKKIDEMTNKINEYREFIGNAADQYEWKDNQIARWHDAGLHIPGWNPDTGKYTEKQYDEADYQHYVNDTYTTEKGTYKLSYNCWGFVDRVLQHEGRPYISGRYTGGATIRGFDQYQIDGGQYIIGTTSPSRPTADDIQAIFQNAEVGDVVQMLWNSRVAHTALVADINQDGVYFLEANNPGGKILVQYYTWSDLANRYSNAGDGGGATIYRPN